MSKKVIVKETQKTEQEMLKEAQGILQDFKDRGTHPIDALIVLEMAADTIRNQVLKMVQNEPQTEDKKPMN